MSIKPFLPMYCLPEDLPVLYALLGDDLAFIVPNGDRRWRATFERPRLLHYRMALWHVAGGPLSVISGQRKDPTEFVDDPWSGWTQKRHPDHGPELPLTIALPSGADYQDNGLRPGIDVLPPVFAPDPTNVFWLNLCTIGRETGSVCGLSSFGWTGNRHAASDNRAPDATKKRWAKLKRDLARAAVKVPRGGIGATADQSGGLEAWALAHAAQTQARFDINPTLR